METKEEGQKFHSVFNRSLRSSRPVPGLSVGEWIGILLFAASFLLLADALRLCLSRDIWYDELFTMGLTGHSVRELIGFTAKDVHPPFYYLYVKAIIELCKLLSPAADPVVIGKLCSALPFFLLLGYALFKVRRYGGMLCAGLFSFCIVGMPQLSQYTVEIRMYSLCLFLVTAAFLHAWGIVRSAAPGAKAAQKKADRLDFLFLFLYGILAAYTHYFACVAIGMIYLWLLIYLLFKKTAGGRMKRRSDDGIGQRVSGSMGQRSDDGIGQRSDDGIGQQVSGCIRQRADDGLKRWGLCAGLSVVCYIPWLYAVVSQVRQVKESYWILPLTLRSLGGCVKFLFKPSFANETVNVLLAVIFFLVYAAFILWAVLRVRSVSFRRGKEDLFLSLSGPFVLGGVVLFGFIASFCIRPVFIYRYMLPAMGVFWLCFALSMSRLWDGGQDLCGRNGCGKDDNGQDSDGQDGGSQDRRGLRRHGSLSRMLFALLLLLVTATGFADFLFFRNDEINKREQMERTQEALAWVQPEDIVIFNFNQLQGTLGYYLANDTFLWMEEPEELIGQMFDGCGSVKGADTIKEWLSEPPESETAQPKMTGAKTGEKTGAAEPVRPKAQESGRSVWFMGSGNAREELAAQWEEEGIGCEERGDFLLERYWFRMCRLYLKE